MYLRKNRARKRTDDKNILRNLKLSFGSHTRARPSWPKRTLLLSGNACLTTTENTALRRWNRTSVTSLSTRHVIRYTLVDLFRNVDLMGL